MSANVTIQELKALMEEGKAKVKAYTDMEQEIVDISEKIKDASVKLLSTATPADRREILRLTMDMMKFSLELRMERALREDERAEGLELLASAGKNTGLA